MIAFDADVLSLMLAGHAGFLYRAGLFPAGEQTVPIIVVEEVLRGRLNGIRRAEAKNSKTSLERAYELLEITFNALQQLTILSYSTAADDLYKQWRSQGLRVGTHDLRIAAICVASSTTLITRNRRDFEKIPELSLEVWT